MVAIKMGANASACPGIWLKCSLFRIDTCLFCFSKWRSGFEHIIKLDDMLKAGGVN